MIFVYDDGKPASHCRDRCEGGFSYVGHCVKPYKENGDS